MKGSIGLGRSVATGGRSRLPRARRRPPGALDGLGAKLFGVSMELVAETSETVREDVRSRLGADRDLVLISRNATQCMINDRAQRLLGIACCHPDTVLYVC
ncbi:unnamed protein product, partial [Brenthis ino]